MPTTFDFLPLWQQIAALAATHPSLARSLVINLGYDWAAACDPATRPECDAIRQRVLTVPGRALAAEKRDGFEVWRSGQCVMVGTFRPIIGHPKSDYFQSPVEGWEPRTIECTSMEEVRHALRTKVEDDNYITVTYEAEVRRPEPSPERLAELLAKAQDIFASLRRS
jgi:hypothetical protein